VGETDDFEWDDRKAAANLSKHGFPLPLAALLFDGRKRLDRLSRHQPDKETRFETIAPYLDSVLLCVWVQRGRKRRVVSLRIANRSERRAYQEAIGRS
jgi:uncharacterized DUF497 family protein